MDVFCEFHGRYLKEMARDVYGVECVPVLSEYMADYFTSMEGQNEQQQQEHEHEHEPPPMPRMPSSPEEAAEWRRALLEHFRESEHAQRHNYGAIELRGLVCESDPGLADAERLCGWLNVTHHNGFNEARRNKFQTLSALAARNIPAVRQRLCGTVEEAIDFAADEFDASRSAERVVVKPVRGCASDDVFLCNDLESVRSAYDTIKGSTVLGSPGEKHESVLVQEYAVGQEYAIDTVTKNGKLKIAAVWKYDKRPQPPTIEQQSPQTLGTLLGDSDGSGDEVDDGKRRQVYYATRLFDDDDDDSDSDPLLSVIYQYLDDCLNALGIRWGMTHSELIMTPDGPRLIEVNCRQHNMNFVPLTDNGIGYNLYDMLLAAYFGDDNVDNDNDDDPDHPLELLTDARVDWDLLPDYPSRRMNAAMVHLVNDKKGVLQRLNEDALYEIQSMQSVLDLEVFPEFLQTGVSVLEPTVDIKTDAGWIQMIHPDPEVFERDYQRIMELMPTLFEV
eukprot:jgi/Psemu1/297416/fgenesh1_pm.289_\